ncbi:hypothetical protein Micbo1qcDRAFT_206590 [Microdochium bolleyi]|uniref:Uncharacterized protein n=1 Tax=Microdochium bolleyi TaxID=196109 RepID=A0A136IVI1_9PEZI|nr:hypothetical protein Micbo1qcDRAFT_206590 [Microdochium bolleyi]
MRGTANAGLLPLRQSLESIFIFPSDNEAGATFHLGDVLEVSWTSNYTDPLLWQWCRDPSYGTPYDYIQWAEPVADFNGSVSVPLGPQFGDECWFELFSGDRRKSTLGPRWKFDNNTRNGLPYQSIPSRPDLDDNDSANHPLANIQSQPVGHPYVDAASLANT